MKPMISISAVATAVALALLGGCNSDSQTTTDTPTITEYQYSTKAVYTPQQSATTYQAAPTGFNPVFTELVARHGSRSLSSPKYDVLTKQIWEQAASEGALTALGQTLGHKVDLVTAANEKMGYGLLSQRGKDEHAQLATRLADRLPTLLEDSSLHCLKVETSGKDRANESAYYFMQSLKHKVSYVEDSADCYIAQTDASKIDKKLANKFELYFHKTEPEGDYAQYLPAFEAYQAFIGNEDDGIAPHPDLAKALDDLKAGASHDSHRNYEQLKERAADILRDEMADFIELRDDVAPDERLFAVTKHFLAHEMERGCKASGVKRIRVHDIRHSHVSLLIEMGFSALAIAERMGHEAVDITYRYAHLFPTKQDEMAAALDGARG